MCEASKSAITEQGYRTAFYDCDKLGRMKMSSILKITAELAGYDYALKGLDHEFLWERGFVFLLSRISIRINKFPTDQEQLSSQTWENGKKGATFLRQYTVNGTRGAHIEGTSGWILCNPQTRKIIKPSEFPFAQEQVFDREINAKPIGRITAENPQFVGEHRVQLSDLDSNGHTYNANYADFAVNVLTEEEFARNVSNFRINYIKESRLGDTISLYKEVYEDKITIFGNITEPEGEHPCFECEFTNG